MSSQPGASLPSGTPELWFCYACSFSTNVRETAELHARQTLHGVWSSASPPSPTTPAPGLCPHCSAPWSEHPMRWKTTAFGWLTCNATEANPNPTQEPTTPAPRCVEPDPDDCARCGNPYSHHRSVDGVLMCCAPDGESLLGTCYARAARSRPAAPRCQKCGCSLPICACVAVRPAALQGAERSVSATDLGETEKSEASPPNQQQEPVLKGEGSVASMAGILAGYTHCGTESDAERIEWLEAQGVVSIYLRDGSQINPASLSLRAALDLVVERSWSTNSSVSVADENVFLGAPETAPLTRMPEKATVRLGILRDRMEACVGQGHALSLEEIPAWIDEQKAALAARPAEAPGGEILERYRIVLSQHLGYHLVSDGMGFRPDAASHITESELDELVQRHTPRFAAPTTEVKDG